jgi:hypothetical protein
MKKLKLKIQTPKETAEQATVIDWARGYGSKLDGIDMLHSIPNGAVLGNPHYNRFALIGKLKAEGLRPGVSDLFLACARKGFHGLYIEMKRRKAGTLSEEQISWLIRAGEEGYKTATCETALDAIAIIQQYLED